MACPSTIDTIETEVSGPHRRMPFTSPASDNVTAVTRHDGASKLSSA